MKPVNVLCILCLICLAAGALSLPTLADSYNTPLYTGQVFDGQSKTLGSYGSQITFTIANGTNYVNVIDHRPRLSGGE